MVGGRGVREDEPRLALWKLGDRWVGGIMLFSLFKNILVCSMKTQAVLLLKTLRNASKADIVLVSWKDF